MAERTADARVLDEVFRDSPRRSRDDIQRRAADLDAPSALVARISALPDRDFTRDELEHALPADEDGVWRSERDVPAADLQRAMGGYAGEGQVDDDTGGDAGAEAGFGEEEWPGSRGEGDAPPGSASARRVRPSPDGSRIGPV